MNTSVAARRSQANQSRKACQEREADGTPQQPSDAAGSSQGVNGKLGNIPNLTEAERFAAAVAEPPPAVCRFFQAEEPIVSLRQSESAQDRL